jgi:PAS domain S-box-containing protein
VVGAKAVQSPTMPPEPWDKQAWLAAIVDSSLDAIIGKTLDGRITSWNAAAEKMYGYAAHEVIGRSIDVIVPTDRRAELRAVYAQLRQGERIESFETERVTKDGQRLAIAISLSPIRNPAGVVVGVSVIARDITERLRAEKELEQSQRELVDFVENSVVGLHWVGPDGTVLWANQAELDLLGYSSEEYIGHHIAEFHADQDAIADILDRLLRHEQLTNYEAQLRCKDGSIRSVFISSNVYTEDGKFVHTRCFTSDNTERKQVEILIAGQKRALEQIAQGAPLEAVLETLARTYEQRSRRGALASVLLLDGDGLRLRHGAAPSLPESYNRAIDGLAIGPAVGSCGTAAHRREPVMVSDITTDPLWADFRDLALQHGLRACWSTPILARNDELLGTYAIYYREPRTPSAQALQAIGVLSQTAAIAIEAKRAYRQPRILIE